VLVDPVRSGEFLRVDTLAFDVVAGRAASLAAVAPSTVAPGEQARLRVRAEDYWGTRARDYDATLAVEAGDGVEAPDELVVEDGVGETTFVAGEGVNRVGVRDEGRGFAATANPTLVDDAFEDDRRTFWGDVHGQSGETVGTGTVREYFAYARDSGFVDFAAHAGNDFQITDDLWETIQEAVRTFHDPGEFVTFPCYEWSAHTPNGGDHNVYFRDDAEDGHPIYRSSRWLVTDDDDERAEGTHPVERLYDRFEGRDDVLIIPHQGGRPAPLDAYDPDLTPFLEITSVWGVFEWFGEEALDRGYRVGFVGGSDDHSGRPGATPPDMLPKHNVDGGLMGARADALSREALWDAFTDRRVYATTGERILLRARVDGEPMGGEVTADPAVDVGVHGTAPVQEVDLFRGDERVARETLADAGDGAGDGTTTVEVRWSGAKGTGRDKVVDWSGGLSLSRGAIRDVEPFGIDRPTQGVVDRTTTSVEWEATTTGDHQGVRLAVEAPADTTLAVHAGPASASAALDDLDADGSHRIDAGLLDAALSLRRASADAPLDADLRLEDPDPPAGTHPYYVRVRQVDGEMAWSSPTFVTVA